MTIGIASTKQKHTPIEIEQEILRAIHNIQYGSIEIIIHDGRVVQIECREKIRIGHPG
ncbi:YezD family protein [Nitrosomonas sp. ANs5]|uniref:YezD family protein n=1 Tax=Nitrosomonas sp. ANs5 TaxID=3423941 RepID=UPI003D33F7D7